MNWQQRPTTTSHLRHRMHPTPIIFLTVLVLELLVGTWMGAWFRQSRPNTSVPVIAGFSLYVLLCVLFAALATQFSGPDSRHPTGSGADQIREYVIGPTQAIWFVGPAVLAFFVAYVKAGRAATTRYQFSVWWYLLALILSCLFLPLWFSGLAIHGANYAGAWL